MLTDNVQKALNDQVNAELYSAYLYLSMNAYFKSIGLEGFANWMSQQAHEETLHAMKIYAFIHQRGGRVTLAQVDAPPVQWDSALAVFEATLEHEQKVTALINDLVELAQAERDHATNIFLEWFVSEQVEEEESVGAVLDQLKLLGDAKSGLFMVDRELAQRQAPGAGEAD
jgi:ferritin